jgi:hypothetical protein
VPSSGYVTRASRRRLPAARSAGNRVEAANGASFVVFIFLAVGGPVGLLRLNGFFSSFTYVSFDTIFRNQ